MEMDVALDPLSIGGFGAQGVVLESHDLPHLLQEFEFGIWDKAFAGF